MRVTGVDGVKLAEGDLPAEHHAALQRGVLRRAGQADRPQHLFAEAKGTVVEAELGEREREVADRDAAPEDVAAALERLHRLLHERETLGDVLAAECVDDEGVAEPEVVAGLARERERPLRRRAQRHALREARVREGGGPLGTPLADRVAELGEEGDRALGAGHRGGTASRAQLGLGEPEERLREQGLRGIALGPPDRTRGGFDREWKLAAPNQQHRAAVQRTDRQLRLRVRVRQRRHRIHVVGCVVEPAARDARLGALVEQRRPRQR
jgi:hypothetical protein